MGHSTFYYALNESTKSKATDKELKLHIQRIYDEHHGCYGYRRITLQLRNENILVNGKRVFRLMREMQLKAKQKRRKYNSHKGNVGKIASNRIDRDFRADFPNQKWTTDITMIKIQENWLYLSPILDMFNGEIVSYTISHSPEMKTVMTMLDKAFATRKIPKGLLLHSDQGWQYQHKKYCAALQEKGIIQSMSRKGNCYDNAIMESWFGLMKNELLYSRRWSNETEFIHALDKYIDYYNHKRIKQRLGGKSPVQYRLEYQSKANICSNNSVQK